MLVIYIFLDIWWLIKYGDNLVMVKMVNGFIVCSKDNMEVKMINKDS